MLHRQRQKRVRADALHRIGNREQTHPHTLHKTTSERLGRDAHHRHAAEVRGKVHHEALAAPDGRRETPQVYRDDGVTVLVATHAQRPAQVDGLQPRVLRTSRVPSPLPLGGLGEQRFALLIRKPHAQRSHHQQVAVSTLLTALRRPRPVRRQLRRPHLAIDRARCVHHVDLGGRQRQLIFVHLHN